MVIVNLLNCGNWIMGHVAQWLPSLDEQSVKARVRSEVQGAKVCKSASNSRDSNRTSLVMVRVLRGKEARAWV